MPDAAETDAKAAALNRNRGQQRPFGAADPITHATSTPTVYVPVIPDRIEAFRGKARLVTGPRTTSPQTPLPPRNVRVFRHPSTNERVEAGPEMAQHLLSRGWIPMDVVDAKPPPKKPYGRL